MNLTLASSPHIRGNFNTRRIMLDVVLSLMPALGVGTYVLGVRSLLVALVCISAALLAEYLHGLIWHRGIGILDGSGAVTGLLLAMTLPASIPLWQAAVGGAFAIWIAKASCGGLGENVFNPALAGRALMMLLWPAQMTRYYAPGLDGVSVATPLHRMRMPALPDASVADMFLGRIPGSIGEISALALLIGAAYLFLRRVISLRIPLAYLGSAALLNLLFYKTGNPAQWTLYSLLSGGLLLGAFYMATDYATSPVTHWGQVIFGAGCGMLTVLFRRVSLYPEGVTYAILLMNACVWWIDRCTAPRRFGNIGGGL